MLSLPQSNGVPPTFEPVTVASDTHAKGVRPLASRLTLLLLAVVFMANVYRAATQGITIDEAYTYTRFVAPPLWKVMTTYDGNHHVLNSLLAKLTCGIFGVSELTLRMPSLAGGLIYLFAARAIVFSVFGTEWAIAGFSLLSLNPFVLDYLIAARGYGLALGFWMTALLFFLRYRWLRAGVSAGLALASNLTLLLPVAALGGMALVESQPKHFGRFVKRVIAPAWLLAVAFWAMPLSRATPDQFYYSTPLMRTAVTSFINLSLGRITPDVMWVIRAAVSLGILVLAGSAAACIAILRSRQRSGLDRLILMNGGAMVVCFTATWLAHVTLGLGYPFTRTGVYWPVMLSLGGAALVERFVRFRALRWTALLLAALCSVQFVREFDPRYFDEWKFDAGSKRIAAFLLKEYGRGKVRVAVDQNLSHSLLFYRNRNGALWDLAIEPGDAGDVYVLLPDHYRTDLKLLYRDPVSQAVIMR